MDEFEALYLGNGEASVQLRGSHRLLGMRPEFAKPQKVAANESRNASPRGGKGRRQHSEMSVIAVTQSTTSAGRFRLTGC